nr:MAG TPA: hypothetical protein [Caudoviricetes sp.]
MLITAISKVIHYNGQNKKALRLVLSIMRAMNTTFSTFRVLTKIDRSHF